ncbi:MAG TPA: hypothetical protein DHW31_09930 [Bacteroides graminisolvens]|uniref:FimB/Mfa2 family fimbrial subunit n=1 Tax=Bacteroides graminisolvens TaxID=477666 RepID=A0A3D2SJJ6_9BACE|nr:hypothetical protein [Bacteroides graminisolvens]
MKYKMLFIALCSFALIIFASGCTKAELCEGKNVTLYFQYKAGGTQDVLPEYIGSVMVYVYDAETGKFVQSAKVSNNQLLSSQQTDLLLDPGKYDVICWGNVNDNTLLANVTLGKTKAIIANTRTSSEQQLKTTDPLYYAKTTLEVSSEKLSSSAEVNFCCAHIDIWVYVKGIIDQSTTTASIAPVISVGYLPSSCDFDMRAQGDKICYYPESSYREDRLVYMSHCSVFRFDENTDASIYVYNGSNRKLIDKISLCEFISKNQISISQKEEVSIAILLEYSPLGVTISIPDWKEVPVSPQW